MIDKDETEIPLPNVLGSVLNKVVTYLKYHVADQSKEIEKPLKSANMNEVVSQWDADFVDVDQELLFSLILAANYMDIKASHMCSFMTPTACCTAVARLDLRQGRVDDQGANTRADPQGWSCVFLGARV